MCAGKFSASLLLDTIPKLCYILLVTIHQSILHTNILLGVASGENHTVKAGIIQPTITYDNRGSESFHASNTAYIQLFSNMA